MTTPYIIRFLRGRAILGGIGGVSAGAPVVLYTDFTAGPVSVGEGSAGCYLSIYGLNLGTFADYGTLNRVKIGGQEVANYRCLAKATGAGSGGPGQGVYETWGIKRLTVQVGSAGVQGLTLGTAYAVSVEVGALVSNVNDLNGNAITFTPNPGRIIFVSPGVGVNPAVGTVPDGSTFGGFSTPVKDLQGYDNGSTAFYGALTCPNSATSTPTSSTTLPPGSHVICRGNDGSYTKYLTNTSFGANRWACFWQLTGNPPTGSTNTGPLCVTSYPGAAGADAPETATFVGAGGATGNAGGLHGTDGARSTLNNSFNSAGYGKHIQISNVSITANPSTNAADGSPINLQNQADSWRVVNNECVWKMTGATAQSAGVQVCGANDLILGNWIHDIFGSSAQENHGIYNGAGGGNSVQNVEEAYNCIFNITNPTGVSVANGGSGIQFHTNDSTFYTGCKVHHNWIDTVIKNGLNCVQGSKTIDIWNNVLVNVQQIPLYVGSTDITLLRFTNNTVVGWNTGNNFGYGGSGYSTIWNNGSGLPASCILAQNNVFYEVASAPTYSGYVVDNSSTAVALDTNDYYDAAGWHTSKPSGDTNGFYGDPLFVSLGSNDFHPGLASPLPNAGVTPPSQGTIATDLLFVARPQGVNTKIAVGALERVGG